MGYQRYDSKVQSVDITTAAYSSDAQTMDIQMTLKILQEMYIDKWDGKFPEVVVAGDDSMSIMVPTDRNE